MRHMEFSHRGTSCSRTDLTNRPVFEGPVQPTAGGLASIPPAVSIPTPRGRRPALAPPLPQPAGVVSASAAPTLPVALCSPPPRTGPPRCCRPRRPAAAASRCPPTPPFFPFPSPFVDEQEFSHSPWQPTAARPPRRRRWCSRGTRRRPRRRCCRGCKRPTRGPSSMWCGRMGSRWACLSFQESGWVWLARVPPLVLVVVPPFPSFYRRAVMRAARACVFRIVLCAVFAAPLPVSPCVVCLLSSRLRGLHLRLFGFLGGAGGEGSARHRGAAGLPYWPGCTPFYVWRAAHPLHGRAAC